MALFTGFFTAINLLAKLRTGFDANLWWIDFRPLPAWIGTVWLGGLAALLVAWAVRPRKKAMRMAWTIAMLAGAIWIVVFNVIAFYRLKSGRQIRTAMPIPFSLLVLVALLLIFRKVTQRVGELSIPWAIAGFCICAVGFPLGQILSFGLTDYPRPADAIVVFGARAYSDGNPSDALEDRVLTAIDLNYQKLAPRLIFSGGPGDGKWSEAQVMKRIALERGVPESAIFMDQAGLTTDATVQNVARMMGQWRRTDDRPPTVLAVTHAWHLPRVKLRFEREGLIAYTVHADERGQLLRQTPYLVAREIAAIWVYYLRAVLG